MTTISLTTLNTLSAPIAASLIAQEGTGVHGNANAIASLAAHATDIAVALLASNTAASNAA